MHPREPGAAGPPSPHSFLGRLSPPASLHGSDTEMSDQEVTYATLRFLPSPSESKNILRHGGTQMPGESDDKEFSVPWHLISVTLGIFCLLLLMAVIVLGTMMFQHIQEKHQQDEILQNLTQKYHSMQNDNYFKEQLLTNKTLEYDIIKNKTLQHKKALDSLLTEKNRCHIKVDIFSKSLQNKVKLSRGFWSCDGISCYYFTIENETWIGCYQNCQNYGLSPLKIDDDGELTWLQPHTQPKNYWIGLSYNKQRKKWEWIENDTPGIDSKVPNLSFKFGNCAFLTSTRIESANCLKSYSCICEKRIDDILSALIETKKIK